MLSKYYMIRVPYGMIPQQVEAALRVALGEDYPDDAVKVSEPSPGLEDDVRRIRRAYNPHRARTWQDPHDTDADDEFDAFGRRITEDVGDEIRTDVEEDLYYAFGELVD